jgi:hypothetical protein
MQKSISTLTVPKRFAVGSETGRWVNPGVVPPPLESVFSLARRIAALREAAENGDEEARQRVERIDAMLRLNPRLGGPIENPHDFAGLASVFGEVFEVEENSSFEGAVFVQPFSFRTFHATGIFRDLLSADGDVDGRVNGDVATLTTKKRLVAYAHVLKSVYGIVVPMDSTTILAVRDPETGLDRYLKLTSDLTYTTLEHQGDGLKLDEDDVARLVSAAGDLEVWEQLVPLDRFRISGVEIINACDVTDEQVLSSLKDDLLEEYQLLSPDFYTILGKRLRAYLRKPDLQLGLSTADDAELSRIGKHREGDCLFADTSRIEWSSLEGTVFERSVREGELQLIDDLSALSPSSPVEQRLSEQGVRTLVSAPLYYKGDLIGLLYLWSGEPGYLDRFDLLKLIDVLPLFAIAIRRHRMTLEARVQEVILEQYTAIHPSVAWRFRKAALNYIRKQNEGHMPEPEPIVFEEVYPLYGVADIRASSDHRNEAVRHDLIEHLDHVAELLDFARRHKPLPILDHLGARIQQYRASLEEGLTSGAESNVKDFIRRNIEPLLNHFRAFDDEVAERIDAYWQSVDPENGTLYSQCRAFDESVERVNRTISTYLMEEEQKAQALFPHYFEKHETDGVEFSIYVGESLIEDGVYNPIYVKNMRLWQLMVMAGIARRVEPLKNTLKVPLDVTYLILTQNAPLTIRFQLDEQRFDVDGTYDIRYEIMKRRIDKALLKNRSERLTQPGKIAIVYTQDREAQEYEEYIRFLETTGHLTGPIEDVELEDLQGMTGLRALRVRVATGSGDTSDGIAPEMIEQVVQGMPKNQD